MRPHRADCTDRTGSAEHPDVRTIVASSPPVPPVPPRGRVVADFTNLGFALDSNIIYADEETPDGPA